MGHHEEPTLLLRLHRRPAAPPRAAAPAATLTDAPAAPAALAAPAAPAALAAPVALATGGVRSLVARRAGRA